MPSAAEQSARPQRGRQIYGRRVGRALTDDLSRQIAERLPALRLDLSAPAPQPVARLFPAPVEDIWLEIGFGGGEHLLYQALSHPRTGFIGCEPFLSGVAKLVRGVTESGLETVRLYDDDARHVLGWLPESSIGRAFVLFPDPWPKKRHRKRRFLGDDGLSALARVLRPGATLRFATDIADYAAMVTAAIDSRADFRAAPGLYADRPADWPLTRYAEKAVEAGRECRFFEFERA
ncbi:MULTISPECIES: tRNA (guanine(46)-N(7))-methyltransferase TrmB [Rhodomicrobium]|uniref:tRNA (guanine(46)-N(7))-methyltransferase TrmB n=1 Tax=Rhodomicrobium TaxID=1068 RepID=UPI000B4A6260|nr:MULTISPECIES: tRNA (guanine(46)-N(7))-methyltransferase TrmB [Rhodomicrobium]